MSKLNVYLLLCLASAVFSFSAIAQTEDEDVDMLDAMDKEAEELSRMEAEERQQVPSSSNFQNSLGDNISQLCAVLDQGYVHPPSMDDLLTQYTSIFTPDIVLHIENRKQILITRGVSHKNHCDSFGNSDQRAACIMQNASTKMASYFDSLLMAIKRTPWRNTPYGRYDIYWWASYGKVNRPSGVLMPMCVSALTNGY